MINRIRNFFIYIFFFIFFFMLFVVILLTGFWVHMKIDIGRNSEVYSTTWNNKKTCYANVYLINFNRYGTLGDFIGLVSSPAFLRVYDKDGNLLKSTEWLLFKTEALDVETVIWGNFNIIYPREDGYQSLTLPECRQRWD